MIRLIKSAFHKEAETKKALAEFILSSPMLSMSAECKKFEEAFAKKQSRKYALFVNSGSSANLLLIQALLNVGKLKKGDRVGFSALTWATNVMPLFQLGLVPVPLDCELNTLNVSPKTIEANAGNLNAVFLTNVLGFSDDILGIKKICEEKNILLLEDNCEALGSIVSGIRLGNFGFASTFSFFVGHHLSTIEGGMVVTDDEAFYDALLIARAHGWNRNLSPQKKEALGREYGVDSFYSMYTFFDLAYNARPTELNGFLGNTQLPYWDEIVSARAKNFSAFHEATKKNENIIPLDVSHMEVVSNFAMPIVWKTKEACEERKKAFVEAEVEVRPVISGNITRQPFYKKYSKEVASCPNADLIHENGFYFGNNQELTDEEMQLLSSLVQGSK